MNKDLKIDLVYLWVNGNDTKWQEEKEEWQTRLNIPSGGSANNCRFIDNQELKYSLRSVEMNAPWINHIFIVTNGQVPEWLDTTHPKITIVTHKEIMPSEALPTFNSEAIETCIANIPGLSEYFLYANDDMFISNPIGADYFFDENGNPIIRMQKLNWNEDTVNKILFCKNVLYSKNLIKKTYKKDFLYTPSHNIEPYRKSYYLECKNKFSNEFYQTCLQKFRTSNCVQRTIQNYYLLASKGIKRTKLDKRSMHISLTYVKKINARIKKDNPLLLCINDCENTTNEDRKGLKRILVSLFNKRAPWEKPKDYQIEPAFGTSTSRAIVFSPDNKFCKYFGVALQSLIDNSKNYEDYDIIIFDADISERNKKILAKMIPPNFKLRFFDINEFLLEDIGALNLKAKDHWSISMYYRIFIPLVMRKYNKVLYCDSDICFNNPISELFDIEMDNKALLVIQEEVTQVLDFEQRFKTHFEQNLKLKDPCKYFNSGVIMFNIQKIPLEKYVEDFTNLLETTVLKYPDQDILNIMFQDKVKFISWKWNFQYHIGFLRKHDYNCFTKDFREDYFDAQKHPCIIHYTSSRKPWHSPQEELADVFWYYARRCPFYEEILYTNLKTNGIREETLRNLNLKGKIYYNYYRAKLLSFLTFGKKKKHYQEKRDNYKKRVNEIRKFSRL